MMNKVKVKIFHFLLCLNKLIKFISFSYVGWPILSINYQLYCSTLNKFDILFKLSINRNHLVFQLHHLKKYAILLSHLNLICSFCYSKQFATFFIVSFYLHWEMKYSISIVILTLIILLIKIFCPHSLKTFEYFLLICYVFCFITTRIFERKADSC